MRWQLPKVVMMWQIQQETELDLLLVISCKSLYLLNIFPRLCSQFYNIMRWSIILAKNCNIHLDLSSLGTAYGWVIISTCIYYHHSKSDRDIKIHSQSCHVVQQITTVITPSSAEAFVIFFVLKCWKTASPNLIWASLGFPLLFHYG